MTDRLLTDEWLEGRDAFNIGEPVAANPYFYGQREHRDWAHGYEAARTQDRQP